ncbi:MAG: winged helix-turn-helix domain-containing protein [Woeseiaceae bacterium]|nr:winged helix-turn-helix domain-containing protein [Woeseiaceae bacterium]
MALRDGFRLGDWEVLPLEGRLQRDGESRRLRPRAMDVLCRLAEAGGDVVERDTLLSDVWGRTAVTDEPLTATVGELRRALGDRRDAVRYVETIPKRGYRLLEPAVPLNRRPADVEAPGTPPEPAAPARVRPRLGPAPAVVAILLAVAIAAFWLGRQGEPGGTEPPRSVAVLPFTDLTPAGDQAWFGDGMAEEVLSLLARIPSLRVASRTSSFSFRDAALPVGEIARALRVSHVLEGSVRQAGDSVRVTAQLVSARDGYNLWAATYDRNMDDLFAIQEDIALQIVDALRISLSREIPARISTTPGAYTLYLQANYLAKQGSADSLLQATSLYLEALDLDADFAPAWSELAAAYANQAAAGYLAYDEGYEKSREAARQAIAAEPRHAPGHERLGWIALWYDGDMRAAARHFRTALDIAPYDPELLGSAAVLVMALGRIDDAIALHEYSFARSPVDPVAAHNLALSYKYAGRLEDAETTFRKVLQLSASYTAARYHLGETLLLMGRIDEALAIWQTEPDEAYRMKGLALAHYSLGNEAEAGRALAELTERFGTQWPSEIAHVHAWRNEPDAAFDWLDREYDTYGAGGWGEWKLQPLYANLHDDPRWQSFLERVNATDDILAAIDFEVDLPD